MDFSLSPEHAALRDTVRRFAREVVLPRAAAIDQEHRFPHDVISAAAEMGLMGIMVPEEHGGAGQDHLAFALAIEAVASACASTAVILDVHNSVAMEPLLRFGNDQQRRRWLPPMARGEVLGGFALSEPGSGSDAAALAATAVRDGGHYVVNGTKTFITNAGVGDLFILMARTGGPEVPRSKAVSAFLLEGSLNGVGFGQPFDKMGLNGSMTAELRLTDVRIPAENLLGREGEGMRVALSCLDSGRIGISAQALGIGGAALAEAVAHVSERQQFGQPIASFQGVQFMLADMATELEAARWLTYRAAVACDQGLPLTRLSSMCKLFSTDTAMRIATDSLQLFGGYGYMEELPAARHFRDAKAAQIYEGTNQVQRVVIARELLRD
ncbi:MAG: acyl-CoA dehydrogenase family protein [Candidatus Dormibacteria bacterium]